MRTALEISKGPATVATTLEAFDRLNEVIGDGSGEANLYREVSPSEASREAGQKCEVRMAKRANQAVAVTADLRADQGDQGARRTIRPPHYISHGC